MKTNRSAALTPPNKKECEVSVRFKSPSKSRGQYKTNDQIWILVQRFAIQKGIKKLKLKRYKKVSILKRKYSILEGGNLLYITGKISLLFWIR